MSDPSQVSLNQGRQAIWNTRATSIIRVMGYQYSDASMIHLPSSYLISLSRIIFENMALVRTFSHYVFVIVT